MSFLQPVVLSTKIYSQQQQGSNRMSTVVINAAEGNIGGRLYTSHQINFLKEHKDNGRTINEDSQYPFPDWKIRDLDINRSLPINFSGNWCIQIMSME